MVVVVVMAFSPYQIRLGTLVWSHQLLLLLRHTPRRVSGTVVATLVALGMVVGGLISPFTHQVRDFHENTENGIKMEAKKKKTIFIVSASGCVF